MEEQLSTSNFIVTATVNGAQPGTDGLDITIDLSRVVKNDLDTRFFIGKIQWFQGDGEYLGGYDWPLEGAVLSGLPSTEFKHLLAPAPTSSGYYYIRVSVQDYLDNLNNILGNEESPPQRVTLGTPSSTTPIINSANPTSFPADFSNHPMQIFGSGFQSGDRLIFVDKEGEVFNRAATCVSAGELDCAFNDANDAGGWTVKVVDPTGLASTAYGFSVAAAVVGPTRTMPTLSATGFTLTANGSDNLASQIALDNPNGDIISEYQFEDGGAGGGFITLNDAAQAAQTWIDVAPSNLANVKYVAGANAGFEPLYVRFYDASLQTWSAASILYATTNVATAHVNPVLTTYNVSVQAGQSIAASSLFSLSNPAGDSISYYQFVDNGSDGGYFSLDGVAQPGQTTITIDPSQLSGLRYVGAPNAGIESLSVQTYDATTNTYISASPSTATTAPSTPVTLTTTNATIDINSTISVASLVNIYDPGNQASTYTILDQGGSGGVYGYFLLNGRQLGAGLSYNISASDLANLQYHSYGVNGTENLKIGVNGIANIPFTITTSHVFPSLAYDSTITFLPNQIVSASNLFSLNNPSNDVISWFDLTDSGQGGGYFLMNGVRVDSNIGLWVTPAQLSSVDYVSGPTGGSENLNVYVIGSSGYTNACNITEITQTSQIFSATSSSRSPAPNDIAHSGAVTGPYNFTDLLALVASYSDLISAFGTNQFAARNWYNVSESTEHRATTFDGLDYIASYSDLIAAFKGAGSQSASMDAGATHYIQNGHNENRTTSFNGLDYIASNSDLIKAFGANGDAGAFHYIEFGSKEGRMTTFDGLDYIASYGDLIKGFGANEQAGAAHYIGNGANEGRTTTFDGLNYIAGYTDLMNAFGTNSDAGAAHYIQSGVAEGRTAHAFDVAAYESAHPDLAGKFSSDDAFLTAYISCYVNTGTFLT